MKTALAALTFATAGASLVPAQVFRPGTVNGAVLGGVAGAIIGNNSGDLRHNAWRGAAIGTVAGALLGSAINDSYDRSVYRRTQVPYPDGYAYSPRYVYSNANYYGSTAGYDYDRPNYAGTGLLLGGLAGAIIGHNDGRHGWEGAAYGAGAGLLLGSLFESQARAREAAQQSVPVYLTPSYATQTAAASAEAPAPTATVTRAESSATSGSAMTSANRLFGR